MTPTRPELTTFEWGLVAAFLARERGLTSAEPVQITALLTPLPPQVRRGVLEGLSFVTATGDLPDAPSEPLPTLRLNTDQRTRIKTLTNRRYHALLDDPDTIRPSSELDWLRHCLPDFFLLPSSADAGGESWVERLLSGGGRFRESVLVLLGLAELYLLGRAAGGRDRARLMSLVSAEAWDRWRPVLERRCAEASGERVTAALEMSGRFLKRKGRRVGGGGDFTLLAGSLSLVLAMVRRYSWELAALGRTIAPEPAAILARLASKWSKRSIADEVESLYCEEVAWALESVTKSMH